MRNLILPFFIALPFISNSQMKLKPLRNYVTNNFSIDVGLSGIQAGAELVVGRKNTVLIRSGLTPVYYNHESIAAGISASAEYRYYYNFSRRISADKEIRNNSANYFGFHAAYVRYPLHHKSDEIFDPTSAIIFGPTWGFNRQLINRVVFNFNLGPAIVNELDRRVTGFSIWADARFLIKLN